MGETTLAVKDLVVEARDGKRVIPLLRGLSFHVDEGECLGILGESGSGKSLTAQAVMGLLDGNFRVAGEAWFGGRNLLRESAENLRRLRGSRIAMVLQNPMTAFDPLCRVSEQIGETFRAHTDWPADKIHAESLRLLERMHIRDPEESLRKYPHQLSGGMLQRIMIGLALALEPELVIADEPTTALDAITQFEVLTAFRELKRQQRAAMIFITHDLGAVSFMADRILVMNHGKIVDEGTFAEILQGAKDPYTRLLIEKKTAVMRKYREVMGKGERDAAA